MYKAELYSRCNNLQRRDVQNLLRNAIKLMKFDNSDVIVDLGCGNGDVTSGILLQEIPSFKRLVGVDISSEMLQFAKAHNTHPKINYVRMDLSEPQVSPKFPSSFDHAFAFFLIHWIENQEQLFNNIFQMLKPGGDFLAICILKCDLKHIFHRMINHRKWIQFMSNVSDVPFPYQGSPNPANHLEHIVEQAGFAHLIKTEEHCYVYDNLEDFKISMESVMPFIKNVPVDRYPEFMNDLIQITNDFNLISTPITPQSKVILPYVTALMYLRKPYL